MPKKFIPYGRQWLDEDDINAVAEVLRSDWLTTGPKVAEFEEDFAESVGATHAVAVSNGTAALHCATHALGIGPGDEVIVPTMTFAATANCVIFEGATPVFADVDRDTLLIDTAEVESRITEATRAVIAVDYAGQPCEYDRLQAIADRYGLALIDDACHALGGRYKSRPVGSLADLNTFSFHPVKHMTTGEGGMVTTEDSELAGRMRLFRNHGIATDHHERNRQDSWYYEMVELGHNYRLTDVQCALGITQLAKVSAWVERRQEIAACYDEAFKDVPRVSPLVTREEVAHAHHLYVVRLRSERPDEDRARVFSRLRSERIGVNVHYVPVHLHPFYRQRCGTRPGQFPVAEDAYSRIISLPMFPRMTDEDVKIVVSALAQAVRNA